MSSYQLAGAPERDRRVQTFTCLIHQSYERWDDSTPPTRALL